MKIKFILKLCLTILFFSVFITQVSASEDTNNNEDEIIIKVGYTDNSEVIFNQNEYINRGYGYDLFRKIEEYSNYYFEFVKLNGNPYDALKNDDVDLIAFYYLDDEYLDEYSMVTTTVNSDQYSLVAKMDYSKDYDLYYDDPQTINGKSVATYHGNPANEILEQYCITNNIKVNFIYGEVYNYINLNTDFYLTNNYEKEHFPLLILDVFPTSIIGNKEENDLTVNISNILLEIRLKEGDFFTTISEKYQYDYNFFTHRTLTREEVSYLQSNPLHVGYLEETTFFSYYNDEGYETGLFIETLNMFSELYNFEIIYEPFSFDENYNVPDDFDILLTAYGKDNKIEAYYTPSEVLYSFDLVAIYNDDILKEHNYKFDITKLNSIGTLNYLFHSSNNNDYINNNIDVKTYNTVNELFNAYNNNEVEAIIITDSGSAFAFSYLNNDNLNYSTIESLQPITFFINNEKETMLIPIINTMIDNISEERFTDILTTEESLMIISNDIIDILYDYWMLFALIVLILLIMILLQERKKRKDVEHALNIDKLTGVLSERYFKSIYISILRNAKPNNYELISLDIDFFKTINTYMGIEVGNELLIKIGKTLDKLSSKEFYVSRTKDDHFIVLKNVNSIITIRDIHYNHILPELYYIISDSYEINFSYGSVKISDPKLNFETVLTYADFARTKYKHLHETTFTEFTEEQLHELNNIVKITKDMEKALKQKEFNVFYQPKIDLNTLKIVGAEALIRWFPPNGEPIYPNYFIPLFENNGFIVDIDLFVFESVCKLINTTPNLPTISVNLSAKTLSSDYIIEKLLNYIKEYDLSISAVELEITESAYSESQDIFLERIKLLQQHGFAISIDDFGAGLSSLNRLSLISPNYLKIDKAFLDTFVDDKSKVILKNIFNMANEMNMHVVAEGVEDKEQAIWLRNNNCQIAQGYYFEKPLNKALFLDLIKTDITYKL